MSATGVTPPITVLQLPGGLGYGRSGGREKRNSAPNGLKPGSDGRRSNGEAWGTLTAFESLRGTSVTPTAFWGRNKRPFRVLRSSGGRARKEASLGTCYSPPGVTLHPFRGPRNNSPIPLGTGGDTRFLVVKVQGPEPLPATPGDLKDG